MITGKQIGIGERRMITINIRKVSKIKGVLNHFEPCNVKKNEDLRLKPHLAGIY
jgi:hypothetical protein